MKINVEFQASQTIFIDKGDIKKFRKLLKEGFCVHHRGEEHLVMRKISKVMVSIDNASYNMTKTLKQYYGANVSAQVIATRLKEDLDSNRVTFELDSETGHYIIVEK